MPDSTYTVATVEVDVLAPVGVVDLGALAVADPDHLRPGYLPARGRTPSQDLARVL
jgi:hypothetical protein